MEGKREKVGSNKEVGLTRKDVGSCVRTQKGLGEGDKERERKKKKRDWWMVGAR